MVVYVEYVVLDNFTLTFLLAALSQKAVLLRVKKVRCFFAASVSTAVVLWYPFVNGIVYLNLIRAGLWIILGLILFLKTKRLIKGSVVFLLLTLVFGGIAFAINYIFSGSVEVALKKNFIDFPLSILLLGSIVFLFLAKKIILCVNKIRDANKGVYEFTIDIFNKKLALKGFIDTGNRLYDERSGLPIVVVGIKSIMQSFSDEQLYNLLSGSGEKLQKGARYYEYCTLSGKSKILLLRPDKFVLYLGKDKNILYDVMIGVSVSPTSDVIKYDAILPPALCA